MVSVVECASVQPETVDCPTQSIPLIGRQETPVLVIVLPPLEWVKVAPFLGNATGVYDLLEQGNRKWNGSDDVCWLALVVGEKLV